MNEVIVRESWASFLEAVTAARAGEPVTLELLDPELGDQHEADHLPLYSVGYDRGDDAVIVELGTAGRPEVVALRHIIRSPRSVAATPPVPDAAEAIRIENADGVTLVQLERAAPPELPA